MLSNLMTKIVKEYKCNKKIIIKYYQDHFMVGNEVLTLYPAWSSSFHLKISLKIKKIIFT